MQHFEPQDLDLDPKLFWKCWIRIQICNNEYVSGTWKARFKNLFKTCVSQSHSIIMQRQEARRLPQTLTTSRKSAQTVQQSLPAYIEYQSCVCDQLLLQHYTRSITTRTQNFCVGSGSGSILGLEEVSDPDPDQDQAQNFMRICIVFNADPGSIFFFISMRAKRLVRGTYWIRASYCKW